MGLELKAAFEIIKDLNFTADCPTAIKWQERQKPVWQKYGKVGFGNESINALFLRYSWPERRVIVDAQVIELYDSSSWSWAETAFNGIENDCLGPRLAKNINFSDLNLTLNCESTALFYRNTICAINPENSKQQTSNDNNVWWQVNEFEKFKWISAIPPGLDSDAGRRMLRDAWPYNTSNITDTELRAWASLAIHNLSSLNDGPQIGAVCLKCMPQLYRAAGFSGNPDISGIGVMISYFSECVLIMIELILWALSHTRYRGGLLKPFGAASKKAQPILLTTIIFFEFSLAIAALKELRHLDSYYQSYITTHAVILTISTLISCLLMKHGLGESEIHSRWSLAISLIVTCAAIVPIALMHLGSFYKPEIYGDGLCVRAQIDNHSTMRHSDVGGYTLFLVIGAIVGIGLWIWFVPKKVKVALESLIEKHGLLVRIKKIAHVFLLLGCVATMLIIMEAIWVVRADMRVVAGSMWIEDAWGFGQILAMLIWAPVLLSFLITLVHEYYQMFKGRSNIAASYGSR